MKTSTLPLPYAAFFWAVPFICIAVVWDAIPQTATQIGLVLVALLIGLGAILKQENYPIVGTPFFVFLLANYWLSNQAYTSPLVVVITTFVFIMLPIVGVFSRRLNRLPVDRTVILHWLILGFLTAQINSLLIFWPFSFFENSLISFLAYYTFWQLIQMFESAPKKSLVAHFVFTLLAAMVVIGAILWVNFPQLRTF